MCHKHKSVLPSRCCCLLLPELYGQSSCTANAHQLLHLAKYVRLWGPLWTHSLFDYANKNGHLKNLFHGKPQVVDQLIFNIDVGYALQLINSSLGSPERSNMTNISSNTYIVGRVTAAKPSFWNKQQLQPPQVLWEHS